MLYKLISKIKRDIHLVELIRGSSTFFVFRILGMAVSYVFTLVVTRSLGASVWGSFVLCLTVLQIAAVFGRLGLDTALLKFIAQFNAQGKLETAKAIYLKSLSIVIPFSLILSIILYFLAPVLSEKVFKKAYLIPYIRLISLGLIPLVLLTINASCFRAFKKIKEYVIFQSLLPYPIGILVLILFFYLNIKKLKAVVYSYFAGIVISFILSSLFLNMFPNSLKVGRKNIEEDISLKYIFSVSFPMLISSSLGMVMGWTDIIMLGMWRTEQEVGIYNVAIKLSMLISFVLNSINSIAAPIFAELFGKKDVVNLKVVLTNTTKLNFLFSFPILLIFCFFPSYVLSIFGYEFRKGMFALILLSFGQFVSAICGSVGYFLNMTGKENVVCSVLIIASLFNIVLNFLLIPKFGINGAALASLCSIVFWNVVFVFYIKLKYGFSSLPLL